MLTKGAIGNLINRYRAVLKKCNLINTFGSLAVAGMMVMGTAVVADATPATTGRDFTKHYFYDEKSHSSSGGTVTVTAENNTDGAGGVVINGSGTSLTVTGDIAVNASAGTATDAARVYGIRSTGAADKHASIHFKNNTTITTSSDDSNWHIGAYATTPTLRSTV